MPKEGVHLILNNFLLVLQLCLGLWQILKLTPAGGMVEGVMGWFLRPLGFSPTYSKLKHLQGRVFKRVRCVGLTTATDQTIMSTGASKSDADMSAEIFEFKSSYLGVPFMLQRNGTERHMLFVDGKMCYYITDKIWVSLAKMANIAPTTAFVRGYKKMWYGVAAGGVMSLAEVMDNLILENQVVMYLNRSLVPEVRLLPVDLSVSEEKLLKVLNLVGLFLQTTKVYWVIPLLFSLTSALLEFLAPLRVWLYDKIKLLFCCIMHLICDQLHWSTRRLLYISLGYWVENLKPSNHIQFKSVHGNIDAIIAGGAKAHIGNAALVPPLEVEVRVKSFQITYHPATTCEPVKIFCEFDEDRSKCWVLSEVELFEELEIDCTRNEFVKLCALLRGIKDTESGSLKSYGVDNRVFVRGFQESLWCYIKNGYPPLRKLKLNNVTVC